LSIEPAPTTPIFLMGLINLNQRFELLENRNVIFRIKTQVIYLEIAIALPFNYPCRKAKPVYSSGSIAAIGEGHWGCTIPERQSLPSHCVCKYYSHSLQIKQEISISALGSVKGKKEGRYLILISLPYISCAKW